MAAAPSPAPELPMQFSVDVDGEVFNVKVASVLGKTIEVEKPKSLAELPEGAVVAPMQGMILAVKVKEGDRVEKGDVVAMIEAMKMQNEIHAPGSGKVTEILVYEGEVVNAGDALMVMEPDVQ